MELLPLLIFIGGIVYTAIASQNKKKSNDEKRNIDRSKIDRQAGKVRQQVQDRTSSSNQQNSDKGLFDSMQDEIKRSFGASDESESKSSSPDRQQSTSGTDRSQSQKADGASNQSPLNERSFGRNFEEKARGSQIGQKVADTYKDKVPADRSKQSERAKNAKESVYTDGIDRSNAEQRDRGLGREAAEEARDSLDEEENSSTSKRKEDTEQPESLVTGGDLTFDKRAVVNGIIFSEILGKPKSRR